MTDTDRIKYLRVVLILIGIAFTVGSYPLMILWPSAGWIWHTGYSDYPLMIVGIYCTLGVFLLLAVRAPLQHLSLIWFTVWSSIVHGSIMMIQSFEGSQNHGHLMGDVPALFIAAAVLAIFTPRRVG